MRAINSSKILSKQNVFNVFHGCTNRCLYCPSRSRLSGVKSFENVGIKSNASDLLEMDLRAKRKKCMLFTGTLGDPYQPVENNLNVFKTSLQVIENRSFGVNILTKSSGIFRDIDLLDKINYKTKTVIQISLSSLDDKICKVLEPGASSIEERLRVIECLNEHHIPIIIRLSPILPLINDTPIEFSDLVDRAVSFNPTGSARRFCQKSA